MTIATGTMHFLVCLDCSTRSCLLTLDGGDYGVVNSVCFSSDGLHVMSSDNTIKVWEIRSSSCLSTLEVDDGFYGYNDELTAVCISADGTRVAAGCNEFIKTVRIWEVMSRTCILKLEGHSSEVLSLCFSPDGSRVISGSKDCTIKVWDVVAGSCLLTLADHTDEVNSGQMSPDGSRIVSGSSDATVKVWDAISGSSILTLQGHADAVMSVCTSFDGLRVVSGSCDKPIKVCELMTGSCMSLNYRRACGCCDVCGHISRRTSHRVWFIGYHSQCLQSFALFCS